MTWFYKLLGRWITLPSTTRETISEHGGPVRTRAGRLNEVWARWLSGSRLGAAVGHWASRVISLPQLRRLTTGEIPWTP